MLSETFYSRVSLFNILLTVFWVINIVLSGNYEDFSILLTKKLDTVTVVIAWEYIILTPIISSFTIIKFPFSELKTKLNYAALFIWIVYIGFTTTTIINR